MSSGRVVTTPHTRKRDLIYGLLTVLVPEKSLLWKKGRTCRIQRGQLEEVGRRLEVAKHPRGGP